MYPYETLSRRGQVGRLRPLAEAAMVRYGLRAARLGLLAHMENTTFRVETETGERDVLRIHRTSGSPFHPVRSEAEVASEMRWLLAVREETGLAVPEPMATSEGELTTVVTAEGVPEPRICVLPRWTLGRFVDAGLRPGHLEQVGAFMARLHAQAAGFAPPPGFVRGRVGDLSGEVAAYVTGMVGEHAGAEAAETVARVIRMVTETRAALGTGPEVYGLIHADLHQENFLFHRGTAGAIDFDDCGWGHLAYDLAVPLSELRSRPDFPSLRAGLLRGYRAVRPFPPEHERHIEVFHGLRLLQLTLWFLEMREHPAFAEWEEEVAEGVEDLTALLATIDRETGRKRVNRQG